MASALIAFPSAWDNVFGCYSFCSLSSPLATVDLSDEVEIDDGAGDNSHDQEEEEQQQQEEEEEDIISTAATAATNDHVNEDISDALIVVAVADSTATTAAVEKRRAVVLDSWNFYRMICQLLRDRYRYQEAFRRIKLDPVYPYFNSLTGLRDVGSVSGDTTNVTVVAPGDFSYDVIKQKNLPVYAGLSTTELVDVLRARADAALIGLEVICALLGARVGVEEIYIAPIKGAAAAIDKANAKYDGDVLRVTDYCRASMVVRDVPSLLALLEGFRDSFGPIIRRVKTSTLRDDYNPKRGGYRDCIVNVELLGHVCEIQIHLWPLWVVCREEGYDHYRRCIEYDADTFYDPYDALEGLDRTATKELIVVAQEAIAITSPSMDELRWYDEDHILDYFAESGLLMKHGLYELAEASLRKLIELRMESFDFGPKHHETIALNRYLAHALLAQGKYEEATETMEAARRNGTDAVQETTSVTTMTTAPSLWDTLVVIAPCAAYDMIIDPNREYREQEERARQEVKASKKCWRQIRRERYHFLIDNKRRNMIGGVEVP